MRKLFAAWWARCDKHIPAVCSWQDDLIALLARRAFTAGYKAGRADAAGGEPK